MRQECHTVRVPGWPVYGTQCIALTTAIRLVRAYGNRIPSAAQIMRDFEVSRATAYRWRAALVESQEGEA